MVIKGRTLLAALTSVLGLAVTTILATLSGQVSAQPRSDDARSGTPASAQPAQRARRFGLGRTQKGTRTWSAGSGAMTSGPGTSSTTGTLATLAAFRVLEGGASRVYVELTGTADIGFARTGPTSLVYTLRGVAVPCKNNRNPLITTHFAGPVARVQLVPNGRDTDVLIELRAAASPTHRIVGEPPVGARLEVDFPPSPAATGASSGASSGATPTLASGPPAAPATPSASATAPSGRPVRSAPAAAAQTEIPDTLPAESTEP